MFRQKEQSCEAMEKALFGGSHKVRSEMAKMKRYAKEHLPAIVYALLKKDHETARRLFLYAFARIHIEKGSRIKSILKANWKNCATDVCPMDRRMSILDIKGVAGMSTENTRFIINEIVRQYANAGVYLEVGIYRGCSLLSAALFNTATRCIGIDNFSQFDIDGVNEKTLKMHLEKFGNPKNIEYYKKDYKEALKDLFLKEPELRVNVYYYDGDHSYENQLEGLDIMVPHLAEKCVILVDDINWNQVKKANRDFIKRHRDFKLALIIRTKMNGSKDWWNGFSVITRGI